MISDIQMPGMSGIDLFAQFERERPDIRIFFISGHAGEHASRIKHPLLDKPHTMDELQRKVAKMVEAGPHR